MMALSLICAMEPDRVSGIVTDSKLSARIQITGKRANIVGMPGLIDKVDIAAAKANWKIGVREAKRQLKVVFELDGAKTTKTGVGAFGQLMRVSPSRYFLIWYHFSEPTTDGRQPFDILAAGECTREKRQNTSKLVL